MKKVWHRRQCSPLAGWTITMITAVYTFIIHIDPMIFRSGATMFIYAEQKYYIVGKFFI